MNLASMEDPEITHIISLRFPQCSKFFLFLHFCPHEDSMINQSVFFFITDVN